MEYAVGFLNTGVFEDQLIVDEDVPRRRGIVKRRNLPVVFVLLFGEGFYHINGLVGDRWQMVIWGGGSCEKCLRRTGIRVRALTVYEI